MSKVLETLRHSTAASAFCISLGVGAMLSVAYLDPSETSAITVRQAVGSIFLLLPGLAHRFNDDEVEHS